MAIDDIYIKMPKGLLTFVLSVLESQGYNFVATHWGKFEGRMGL